MQLVRITVLTEAKGVGGAQHPTEGPCVWKVFGHGIDRRLQLDTFGSDDRENPGKLSQTLQLDERAARELLTVLRQAFPDLD